MLNRSPVSLIVLVGPVAEPGRPAAGGYESSNLRLVSVLRQICPDVRPLAYPQTRGSVFRKALVYARGFLRLLTKLCRDPGRGAAVHMTPLCRHFLVAELLVGSVARFRGYRLVLDLRAGMQETWFRNSSALYRFAFRRLVALAAAVTYEGEYYGSWLESLVPAKRKNLLPNFVSVSMLCKRAAVSLPPAPRLVYVGAVSEAKGVTAALRAFGRLKRRFPTASFVLVGRCDPDYRGALVRQNLVLEGVSFTGALPPEQVEAELDRAHFFLFLSRWFGEGHSNSLTEAMARGCVPMVSRYGFSESVVARPELVISDREDADGIADRIAAIWSCGRWREISDAMVRRVAENYTDLQARDVLAEIYGLSAEPSGSRPCGARDEGS